MATRRATSARLVEGRTYVTPLPRSIVKLTRSRPLVGAQMEQSFIVQGGVLVPVGQPEVSAKQKPVVGSIVMAQALRRSAVSPNVGSTDPVIHPGASEETPAYCPTHTQRFEYPNAYVVSAVSQCGKYVRLLDLAQLANRVNMTWNAEGNTFKLQCGYQHYQLPDGTFTYGYPEVTQEKVQAALRGSWVGYELSNPSTGKLARVSHITRHLTLEQIPQMLIDAMLRKARAAVAAELFARLAKHEALRIGAINPVRQSLRFNTVGGRAFRATKAEDIAGALADARSYLRTGQRDDAIGCLSVAHNVVRDLYRTFVDTPPVRELAERAAQRLIDRFCQRNGLERLRRAPACGHFHEGEAVLLVNNHYGERGLYCPACAGTYGTVVTTSEGTTTVVHRNAVTTYLWSDGTTRMQREPGLIGHRHSGKGVVGFVQPLSGANPGSYITLGLELEMQAVEPNQRDLMARLLKNRLTATDMLPPLAQRKYLHFEEDGSTGPGGFEMVTGYTDLATHAKLLHALFTDNGAPAWQGKLRSHDAKGGSCGIHVHVQKPTSLIHASKIRYFINAAASERLVRDVARRYNDGFARINNRVTENTPQQAAVAMVKDVKPAYRKLSKEHTTMALQNINTNRYEALNFPNLNTVEFRIFRGTTMFGSIMSCLEFSHAVWHFCRFTPATQLTPERFIDWVNSPDNRADTKNLRVYLKRKGWDCYVPNQRKPVPPVSMDDINNITK